MFGGGAVGGKAIALFWLFVEFDRFVAVVLQMWWEGCRHCHLSRRGGLPVGRFFPKGDRRFEKFLATVGSGLRLTEPMETFAISRGKVQSPNPGRRRCRWCRYPGWQGLRCIAGRFPGKRAEWLGGS